MFDLKVKQKFIYQYLFISIVLILLIIFYLNNTFVNVVSYTILPVIISVITIKTINTKKSGLAIVYLSYLALTHLGIGIVDIFLSDPFINLKINTTWYYMKSREMAQMIAAIGITSFCWFLLLRELFFIKEKKNKYSISIEKNGDLIFYKIGIILLLYFLGYLFFMIVTGKIPLFGNYGEYFDSLREVETSYSYSIFLYAMGIIFIFSSGDKINIMRAIPIILLPALILLLTGNRGEVFYPIAAGLGILLIRGIKINFKLFIIVTLVFFLLIPFIKEMRGSGFNNFNIKETTINITDPFIEIGYTLRPHVYTVSWIENNEPFVFGESYLVAIQRALVNFFPMMEPIPYEGKLYHFRDRLPTMGFSVIAEAYYNYGLFGVLSVMGIIANLLFNVGYKNTKHLVIFGGITSILINNIRNAFSFVPGQIIILLILVLFTVIFKKVTTKKINKSVI